MANSIDWRLLDDGGMDIGNALAHYEAGRERRAGIEKQNALANYAASPSEATLAPLIATDPELGIKMRADMRAEEQRGRRKAIIKQYATDPAGAERAAADEGDAEFLKQLRGMRKEDREVLRQVNEGFSRYLWVLRKGTADVAQRKARLQADAPGLIEAGMSPEKLAAYEPTDANIDTSLAEGLTLKEMIDDDRSERQFSAQQADREADNKRADAQLAISRGNLAVSQSNSARGWASHNERKKQGGYRAATAGDEWEEF